MILIIKLIRLIVADDLACDIKSGEIPAANATEPVKDSRCRFQICERDDFGKQIAGQEETEALRSGQPPNMLADVLQPPRQIADPRGSSSRTSRWIGTQAERMASFISRTARSMPTRTARAMMLWPIFSSSKPAMRATACTVVQVKPCPM